MAAALTPERIDATTALIPAAWLEEGEAQRTRYARHLKARLAAPRAFFQEALRARSADV